MRSLVTELHSCDVAHVVLARHAVTLAMMDSLPVAGHGCHQQLHEKGSVDIRVTVQARQCVPREWTGVIDDLLDSSCAVEC